MQLKYYLHSSPSSSWNSILCENSSFYIFFDDEKCTDMSWKTSQSASLKQELLEMKLNDASSSYHLVILVEFFWFNSEINCLIYTALENLKSFQTNLETDFCCLFVWHTWATKWFSTLLNHFRLLNLDAKWLQSSVNFKSFLEISIKPKLNQSIYSAKSKIHTVEVFICTFSSFLSCQFGTWDMSSGKWKTF